MKTFNLKKNQSLKILNETILILPSPSNINYMWNMGSLLGLIFLTQIFTGIFISMHYTSDIFMAFQSTIFFMKNTSNGWMTRFIHMNSASIFFFVLYIHIFKGLHQNSFKFYNTWSSGMMIFITLMATAFLGYVLPWGQMSFWGATVITNLFSAFPIIGIYLVEWMWGGFSIGNPTLNRFYSLHFMIPFIMMFFIFMHLIFLHEKGSSNPSNTNSNFDKIEFKFFFIYKDCLTMILMIFTLLVMNYLNPYILSDPDNFIQANPMITPIHIQPEWYFLFAYAILRSIPNKLGGVISLFMSIFIIYLIQLKPSKTLNNKFNPQKKFLLILISLSFIILTWIGMNPIENPYSSIGKLFTMTYFIAFFYF